ncbi:hypothetical protein NL108_000788 [Boleophthalmus pectinirostris]|uniref:uncharacterized protein LOC110161424 n=1 Tax=Boleophthalmus pectinirostris TaxID=150288 RepID=UPI00242E10B6|nr:uncharacterized protein LOC110161424 [Boleophthalmus pectinirostris]KAJ0056973.1 hypothetical protein NL108_000788 [Boleophthalmus pectinirostris]
MQIVTTQTEIDSFIKRAEDESHSKYVCISVDRGFTNKDWQPLPKRRVYWQWSGGEGSPSIDFTGIPFMFVGGKRLGCHRGKDRAVAQKKKYKEEKAKKMLEDYSTLSQTSPSPHTKKVGCPANICISKIAMFPKFKLSDNKERIRKRTSKALRLALQQDPVVWETCFVITHHSEHSGHEVDELGGKKKRRKRLKDNETAEGESPAQKRARKTRLKNKCIKLTKELLDKLYFIEDLNKLEETSGKLSNLLEDLSPFSHSENERPLQIEAKRARSLPSFTSTLTQKTIQRPSKYTERCGATVCRKSMTQVTLWPVHSVANTLEIE